MVLSAFLLIMTFPFVSCAVQCSPAAGQLPRQEHCFELTDHIRAFAKLPHESGEKTWGRCVQTGVGTEKLPKLFWIDAPEARTCALYLDINERYSRWTEDFSLNDVAWGGDMVTIQCLVGRGKVGLELLGERQLVDSKLVRSDHPWLDGGTKGTLLASINGTELWAANPEPDGVTICPPDPGSTE